jgi:hypothetical protein
MYVEIIARNLGDDSGYFWVVRLKSDERYAGAINASFLTSDFGQGLSENLGVI